jgi:hypothetical protein
MSLGSAALFVLSNPDNPTSASIRQVAEAILS